MEHVPITSILTVDFAELLSLLGGSVPVNANALESAASLKRLEKAIEAASKKVVGAANAAYMDVGGAMKLEHGVTVKPYTKRGSWTYSDELEKLEMELKVRKEAERANGTATETPAEIDPAKDRLFSVTAPLTITADDSEDLLDAAAILSKPATADIASPA